MSDQEIKELLNISQVTLWRWTTKLGFPKPIPGMKGRRPYAEFMAWAKERGMVL
ncbi:helix-turn-helix domain-containing protein [Vibrio cholerae]|nr:helix-turn-helix domain-containing protein [Vibrio cholerae]TXX74583.1 helix-turn-helix domain-containing protein [Vibrio cholerae]